MRLVYSKTIAKAVLKYQQVPVREFNEEHPFYSATKGNGYLRTKVVYAADILEDGVETLGSAVSYFIKGSGRVFLTPIGDSRVIRGFLVRSIDEKGYRVISDGVPMFYGAHRFKDGFKYGDLVILTEGFKDAEAVARNGHPYTLAVLQSTVSFNQAEILKRLTSRAVFIADNDKTGRDKEVVRLNKRRAGAVVHPPFKDLGVYFDGVDVKDFVSAVINSYSGSYI